MTKSTPHLQHSPGAFERALAGYLSPSHIAQLVAATDAQWRSIRHGDQAKWDSAYTQIIELLNAVVDAPVVDALVASTDSTPHTDSNQDPCPNAASGSNAAANSGAESNTGAKPAFNTPGTRGYRIDNGVVNMAPHVAPDADTQATLTTLLQAFIPWRKGPWQLAGTSIDTEWRSDHKWDRLSPHISSLAGRRVLDVGCGNGYHLWRMHAAGAAVTVGIDPGLLFNYQFNVLSYLSNINSILLLPLTLEQFPAALQTFDTVFSMGVLSHRRDPERHIKALKDTLAPGGELVLESLIDTPADTDQNTRGALMIDGRYARMRNVWQLPSESLLIDWVKSGGFDDVRCVSVAPTSVAEQRTTAWMPFESLADSLDPADSTRTIEGHPAPVRAVVVAKNA